MQSTHFGSELLLTSCSTEGQYPDGSAPGEEELITMVLNDNKKITNFEVFLLLH